MKKQMLTRKEVLQENIITKPCFDIPKDTKEDEVWASIPENHYTVGINPNYRISNYGRIINTKNGSTKPLGCYVREGFQYYTLGTIGCKYRNYGQQFGYDRRNFTLANLLLYTFRPVEDEMGLCPMYLGAKDNVYIDRMIDGKLQSNIQWKRGNFSKIISDNSTSGVTKAEAHKICQLFEYGWSINRVCLEMNHILPKRIVDIYRKRIFLEVSRLYDF